MASVTGSRGRRAALALWSAVSPEAGSAQTCHEDVAGDDSANGRCGRSQFSEGIFSADDLCKQRWSSFLMPYLLHMKGFFPSGL